MGALSDDLLREGCAQRLNEIHGQRIEIISGKLAGKFFIGAVFIEPPLNFTDELGEDLREKSIVRFPDTAWPNVVDLADYMKTEDGQLWQFIKRVNNPADVWIDFEIMKVVKGKDLA